MFSGGAVCTSNYRRTSAEWQALNAVFTWQVLTRAKANFSRERGFYRSLTTDLNPCNIDPNPKSLNPLTASSALALSRVSSPLAVLNFRRTLIVEWP